MASIYIEIDNYISVDVDGLGTLDLHTNTVLAIVAAVIVWRYARRWHKRRQVTALLGVIAPNKDSEFTN